MARKTPYKAITINDFFFTRSRKLLFSFSSPLIFNLHFQLLILIHSLIYLLMFLFLFFFIHICREIRQKEIYKMIIDTNPLYINKFFRTVSLLSRLNEFINFFFTSSSTSSTSVCFVLDSKKIDAFKWQERRK